MRTWIFKVPLNYLVAITHEQIKGDDLYYAAHDAFIHDPEKFDAILQDYQSGDLWGDCQLVDYVVYDLPKEKIERLKWFRPSAKLTLKEAAYLCICHSLKNCF